MEKQERNVSGKPQFFWSPGDRAFIVKACLELWPEEAGRAIRRAALAAEGTFIYNSRWDMEPCQEPVTFQGDIQWDYVREGDVEWTYMLNRMSYMRDLGQAYWLTGEGRFAKAYIRLLKDWCANNGISREEMADSVHRGYNVNSRWRRIDASIRFTNWLKGYACIASSSEWHAERIVLEGLLKSQAELHGEFLHLAYTAFDVQSNWGFIAANGLYQIAVMYPELENAAKWKRAALDRMEEMSAAQFLADGFHGEQSPQYHHEVLDHLFETVWLGELNIEPPRQRLYAVLHAMLDASIAIAKPNRRQPMLSDSDDVDVRDKWCQGALLLGRQDLRALAYPSPDYDSLWYFGAQGIAAYDRLAGKLPDYTSKALQPAGLMVMRSGWGRQDDYLLMDGGHLAMSGHGHDDLLHVELHARGRDFLIDTGRYTYKEGKERQYFKPSLQHNTLSVDGLPSTEYIDTWSWEKPALPVNAFFKASERYDYTEAGHDGYWRLSSPVAVHRQILYIKPEYWIIVDTFRSSGKHRYGVHFHFAEDTPLQVDHQRGRIVTAHQKGGNLLMQTAGAGVRIRQEACWIARHYNEKNRSAKIVLETEEAGPYTTVVTLLRPFDRLEEAELTIAPIDIRGKSEQVLNEAQAIGFEIRSGSGGISDYVIISRQGPQSYRFAEVQLTGEVLWLRRQLGHADQSFIVK
ncbi:alginate lyase family protein [Paenibacillus sp. NPDC057967]|uniref:alginate lyase family protein n=1 Tax=Paenibacillus sp. NPDC057967 TaxID=3346293 RepID=UPI0036D82883